MYFDGLVRTTKIHIYY